MDQAAHAFSIRPLSPHTGAEVIGIDLRQPAKAGTAIRQYVRGL